MARAAAPTATTDTLRVTVITTDTSPTDDPGSRRTHAVDVSTTVAGSLANKAIEIAADVTAELTKRRVNTDWLTDPDSALELAPDTGDKWDQTKTLADVGVRNGKTIILTTRRANERYPRLYENLADAAAVVRTKTFSSWSSAASHAFAAAAFPPGVALLALLGAGAAIRHPGVIQWIIAAAFATAALVISVAAVTTAQYRKTAPETPALGLTMHALLAAAAAAAVPSQGWGIWNIAAATVVVAASSAGMIALQAPKVWAHVAVFTAAMSTVVGTSIVLIYGLWREVSTSGAAAAIATVAFLFFLSNVTLARRFARLDMPVLPTPADDISMRQTHDLAAMSQDISTSESWGALIHSEDRNVAARWASMGIMIGAGAVATICAVVAGATITDDTLRLVIPEIDGRWVGILTFAVIAALFILQGTWNVDRGLCATGILSGSMIGMGYIAGAVLLGRDGSVVRVAGMVIVALALMLLSALALFRASDVPTSEKRVKLLQILETVLLVLVLTDALTMLNVFFSVRAR